MQKREDVVKKSKLLAALIGTRGDTKSDGTVEDLFADNDASIGIQDALQNVDGVGIATSENMGVKKAVRYSVRCEDRGPGKEWRWVGRGRL